MTNRLYYDQTYLTSFEARVTAVREEAGKTFVALDQSAFYPTSGGQPYDTGTLNGLRVTDVSVDKGGEVWHCLEGSLSVGQAVHGEIDWARRFDHMQQHAGEHMLAGAIYRLLSGGTIGLHLGADISTIDVTMPDGATHLTNEQILALELDVNEQIQRDVPIRCWFPSPEELKTLPLRKPPTVNEHVRIVAIGDKEMVACGGTHPSSAGQIGMVKIVDTRPSRGKLRVGFLCGMRAFRDYHNRMLASDGAAERLSVNYVQLPQAVEHLQESITALKQEINALRKDQAHAQVQELARTAQVWQNCRLVAGMLPPLTAEKLRDMAVELLKDANAIVLLASPREEGGFQLLFARGSGALCDVGQLMKKTCAACGGRGGGRADFAQGSVPMETALDRAKELLGVTFPSS